MSLKTSIGWTDITVNPIKGLCQGGCWYCYYSGKRGIAHRFKQDPELRLDLSVFDNLPWPLKAPKKVFLCSTNDYWGKWIPDEWRKAIRQKTQEYPQHTFQLLTKQYRNLEKDSPYPGNWWVGGTAADEPSLVDACQELHYIEARIKFLSIEPLLNWFQDFITYGVDYWLKYGGINWLILGRLTGFGKKHNPRIEWVEEIVRACDKAGIPVFEKNNLMPLVEQVFGRENYLSPIGI
ncbi:hypothetical protein ES705_50639 [subsurface metagenome]